jgi:hypothetical protein
MSWMNGPSEDEEDDVNTNIKSPRLHQSADEF